MNFKYQLFHSSPLFSENNILKFNDKIALENLLFVNKSINRQVPPMFYDWFTFLVDWHRYKTCLSENEHLNRPTFQAQKYGCFSIRASAIYLWNSTQNVLIKKFIMQKLNLKKN